MLIEGRPRQNGVSSSSSSARAVMVKGIVSPLEMNNLLFLRLKYGTSNGICMHLTAFSFLWDIIYNISFYLLLALFGDVSLQLLQILYSEFLGYWDSREEAQAVPAMFSILLSWATPAVTWPFNRSCRQLAGMSNIAMLPVEYGYNVTKELRFPQDYVSFCIFKNFEDLYVANKQTTKHFNQLWKDEVVSVHCHSCS